MNLRIIQITPLPYLFGCLPVVQRPPNTKEFNYNSIVIEEDGHYYYWSRGVSIEITKTLYEQVIGNPKLFIDSTSYKLHQRVNKVLGEINYGQ